MSALAQENCFTKGHGVPEQRWWLNKVGCNGTCFSSEAGNRPITVLQSTREADYGYVEPIHKSRFSSCSPLFLPWVLMSDGDLVPDTVSYLPLESTERQHFCCHRSSLRNLKAKSIILFAKWQKRKKIVSMVRSRALWKAESGHCLGQDGAIRLPGSKHFLLVACLR